MISTTDIKVRYTPTTATSRFPFDVRYFEDTDINVEVVDGAGDTTVLTLDAVTDGFTVTPVNGNPELGATIDTTSTYTTGEAVTIYRRVPLTQLADFQRGGVLPPDVLNASLDRGVAISQEIDDSADRHLVCPITDPDGLTYELPTVILRKDKVVGFDSSGNVIAIDVGAGGSIVGVDTSKGLVATGGIAAGNVDDLTMQFDGSGQFAVKTIDTANIATDAITSDKITNFEVDLIKIAQISNLRVLGNTSGGTRSPLEVTIYDQDDMVSDSNVAIATQQSIKAYVDDLRSIMSNVVNITDGEVQYFTGATVITNNDDIPQSNEGSEVMTLAFTPKKATSRIKVDVRTFFSNSGGATCCALYKDSITGALATAYQQKGITEVDEYTVSYIEDAVNTNLRTFKVRVGGDGTTTTFNGDNNNSPRYGGTLSSSITITEIPA